MEGTITGNSETPCELIARRLGYNVKVVTGDGACFFRCVAHHLKLIVVRYLSSGRCGGSREVRYVPEAHTGAPEGGDV